MELKNEYFKTTTGHLGYSYMNEPGVVGQGYGFEDLDEKEQPNDKEMYKVKLKSLNILSQIAKEEGKESKDNKQHKCIYCQVTGKKRPIETHLFKKHNEELRSDLQKYLDCREKLSVPFRFTPKSGGLRYFCLPCKKFWLDEGEAIKHNKTCNIDDQKQAIYDLAMSDNVFVPKIPNDTIQVDNKSKTRTEIAKEYWDKQRATNKILKDAKYADTLESEIAKTNHKLFLERIKKLEQDIKELKEANGKLKEEKPKLEKIYYEKKIAIQKQTFESMVKGLLVRIDTKIIDRKLNDLQDYINKYDYNSPDFEALTYAKDIAKLGREEHLKLKIDLSDLKQL